MIMAPPPPPPRIFEPVLDYITNDRRLEICTKRKRVIELNGKKYWVDLPDKFSLVSDLK